MRILLKLKYAILAILSSILLFHTDGQPPLAPPCEMPDHVDYEPLMAFYNALDGPNWNNNTGWGEECNVCAWSGVFCNNNRVSIIQLLGNSLSGAIPEDIALLDSLRIIRLRYNNISGELPLQLENVMFLREVDLGYNNYETEFPEVISNLNRLSFLNLSGNKFYGDIPDSFQSLLDLERLWLTSNEFTGDLPSSLFDLENLQELHLNANPITGGLSSEVGKLKSLEKLYINGTTLGGTIPFEIGQLSELVDFQMNSSQVQGFIPESLYGLTKLEFLDLRNNQISGNISDGLNNLNNLKKLILSKNNLVNELPRNLSNLTQLENFQVDENELTGTIPNSFYDMTSLKAADLDINNFEDSISSRIAELTNLERLDISRNNFYGKIPEAIINLSKLKNLYMSNNLFSGPFPEVLGNLQSIERISIYNNYLDGCFPDSYLNLCNIISATISTYCRFENPSFGQFCAGAVCNNTLNMSAADITVCEGEMISMQPGSNYTDYLWSEPNQTSKILSTTATTSKYYHLTVTNTSGCTKVDSIYINVISTQPGFESAEICPGKSVTINGETFNELGTFEQLIPRTEACDSTVFVSISAKEGTAGTYTESICPETMTTINGQEFGPGISTQIIPNQAGCDSTITITINEHPTYETYLAFEVCEGTTYNYEGDELSAGLTTFNLLSQYGCDSIINIDIFEKKNTSETIIASFCTNAQVEINNEIFNEADTYTRILTNNVNCDSILTIIVTEREISFGTVDTTFCQGSSILIAGNYYSEEGNFSTTLTNAVDCDSFLTISITVLPTETTNLNEFICGEETYEIGEESFNTPGLHTLTLTNQFGCDSIVNLNLTIISGEDQSLYASTCAGTPFEFAGELYFNSTVVQDSIFINGCKSLTTLHLEVLESKYYEYDQFICEGNSQYFHGYFYNYNTTQTVTLRSQKGCDSIVTMHLFVEEHKVIEIDTFICNGSSLFYDNQLYFDAGRIEIPRKTKFGCDSITYLNIDLYETETDTFFEVVCKGNEIEFFGNMVGVGEYTGTFDDGNCEQNYTLIISEVEKLRYNKILTLCSGGQLEFMGEVYADGGLYHLDAAVNDCEILEDLVVVEKSRESLIIPQVFCEGRSIEIDGIVIETSGIYPVTNNEECEDEFISVLFINGDEIGLEETIREGQGFEFNGELYTESGNYEILLGAEWGCPTILVLKLNVESCGGIRSESVIICEGDDVQFNNQTITTSGIYEYQKPLQIGCDSIIQLTVTVISKINFDIEGETFLCEGSQITLSGPEGHSYLWNNGAETSSISISKGGTYQLTIYNENNCSSYSEIKVEVIRFPSKALGIYVDDPSTCESIDGRISIDVEIPENFLYSIDGGLTFQESNTFSQLSNGPFNIVLSDSLKRCIKIVETPIILESDGVPQIKEIQITPINECQNQLGIISIIPENEEQAYQFSIDNGENWVGNGLFENLESGNYNVIMGKEGSSCLNNLSAPIELENVGILKAKIQIDEQVSCVNASDGAATVQVLEGKAPYIISWSNGGSNLSQNTLSTGNHQLTITDAYGCQQVLEINLEARDLNDLLSVFQDTFICTNETLVYEADSAFEYLIFKGDELYYEGVKPEISETGVFQIIIENGTSCLADKTIEVLDMDLSSLGIDFLLSTETVKGVEVIAVNVSDPMPDNFKWVFDTTSIAINTIDPFASGFVFRDTGSYEISIYTEVNGCLAAFDKTIVVYADSSHLGSYEEPETPIELDQFGSWEVFENPNNGQFKVEIMVNTSKIPIQLAVYDIYGALIESRMILGKKNYLESFNLYNSGTGIYTVVLRAFNQQFSKSILIIK